MQIKREPCQVSEVTTTNFTATKSSSALTAVVKLEQHETASAQKQQQSTTTTTTTSSSSSRSGASSASIVTHQQLNHHHSQQQLSSNSSNNGNDSTTMDGNTVTSGQTNAIPVGIAVARQRLQETTAHTPALKTSDINRFGIGLGDLGMFGKLFLNTPLIFV